VATSARALPFGSPLSIFDTTIEISLKGTGASHTDGSDRCGFIVAESLSGNGIVLVKAQLITLALVFVGCGVNDKFDALLTTT
jgi:hypothetical protein